MILFRFIPVVLVFIFFSAQLNAQDVYLGPRLGPGVRWMNNNDKGEIGIGYHFGMTSNIRLKEKMSLMPSLLISRKGHYEYEWDWWSGESTVIANRLTYLELHIPVRFQVEGIFYMLAGIQGGYMLMGTLNYEVNDGYDPYGYDMSETNNIRDSLNRFDIGALAGAGVLFKSGVGLEVLANPGFIDIKKTGYENSSNYVYRGINMLVTIDVYYLFGYKKKKSAEPVKN